MHQGLGLGASGGEGAVRLVGVTFSQEKVRGLVSSEDCGSMCQGSVARSSGSGSLDTGCTHVSSGRSCGEAREGDTQGVLRPDTREQGAAWSLGVTEAAGASEGRLLPWPPARGAVLIRQKKAGRKVRQYPPILTCPCFSLLPCRKGLTCSMHWISWRTKPSWRSEPFHVKCGAFSQHHWGNTLA